MVYWLSGYVLIIYGVKLRAEAAAMRFHWVGERPQRGEAGGSPTVDCWGVRMLA